MGTAITRRHIISFLLLTAVVWATAPASAVERAVGMVGSLEGEGIVLRAGGMSEPLATGDVIRAGDVLMTGGGSMMELRLDDGSRLWCRDASFFSLDVHPTGPLVQLWSGELGLRTDSDGTAMALLEEGEMAMLAPDGGVVVRREGEEREVAVLAGVAGIEWRQGAQTVGSFVRGVASGDSGWGFWGGRQLGWYRWTALMGLNTPPEDLLPSDRSMWECHLFSNGDCPPGTHLSPHLCVCLENSSYELINLPPDGPDGWGDADNYNPQEPWPPGPRDPPWSGGPRVTGAPPQHNIPDAPRSPRTSDDGNSGRSRDRDSGDSGKSRDRNKD